MALEESKIPDLTYYDSNGNEVNKDGTPKSGGSSGGWWQAVVGVIPGILSALFPTGVNGSGSTTNPTVTTNPYGQTQVNFASSNNLLIIGMVAIFLLLLFNGSMLKPAKKRRR